MQPGNPAEGPPNPGLVFDMLWAYQRTAALKAAIDLGVFAAIGAGPGSVASIAAQCKSSERGIRILCDYLVIHGVLAKQGTNYKHTSTSALFLDPASPACLAPVAQFLGNPALLEPFNQLAEIVRNGRTVLPGEGSVEPDHPMWVQFAESMVPMMAPIAGPLAAAVLEGRSGPMRVLDIAAGHGMFGIALAQQNPQAQITGLDWAAVLTVAERNAKKAGVADRYQLLTGSAFDVAYGGPYDAVLLTNFLHHFDKPTCVVLLKKVHASMRPGGRAAALEFVPNEDRVSPPESAGFAMTMLGTTPSGDAYTMTELTAMFQEAGFKNVTRRPMPIGPETAVLAEA